MCIYNYVLNIYFHYTLYIIYIYIRIVLKKGWIHSIYTHIIIYIWIVLKKGWIHSRGCLECVLTNIHHHHCYSSTLQCTHLQMNQLKIRYSFNKVNHVILSTRTQTHDHPPTNLCTYTDTRPPTHQPVHIQVLRLLAQPTS